MCGDSRPFAFTRVPNQTRRTGISVGSKRNADGRRSPADGRRSVRLASPRPPRLRVRTSSKLFLDTDAQAATTGVPSGGAKEEVRPGSCEYDRLDAEERSVRFRAVLRVLRGPNESGPTTEDRPR
jgi:hypothetical protein